MIYILYAHTVGAAIIYGAFLESLDKEDESLGKNLAFMVFMIIVCFLFWPLALGSILLAKGKDTEL